MRLLDRYLLREFLIPLAYILSAFVVFWLVTQLFADLRDIQRAGLTIWETVQYLVYLQVGQMPMVVPVALLLALLYALTQHSRYNEVTAMRAAGLSLWRLSLPYFATAVFFGVGIFATTELFVPHSSEAAEDVLRKHNVPAKTQAEMVWISPLSFNNDVDNRMWVISAYNVETAEMRRLHLEWRLPTGERREFHAESGLYTNNVWHFYDVQGMLYTPGEIVPARFQTNHLSLLELTETPQQIKSEIKINSIGGIKGLRGATLSLSEIMEYQRWHPKARSEAKWSTKFQSRLAAPFTCLVVVLIAMPFGAASGRRNVMAGVASSIFICFAYFVVQRLAEALGMKGWLPPLLAGWLPNILFSALGTFLTLRVR